MVSIKNRLFTTALIDGYCRFASECLRVGYVTVVDRPYLRNAVAATNGQSAERGIDGVRRLSQDRVRQVRRILRRYDSQRLSFISWGDLAAETPPWLSGEVNGAWEARGCLYSDVVAHARDRANGTRDAASLERWAMFLVEETPVLLYAYYLLDGGVVDIYPGSHPPYLWRIERGDYASELPRTSAIASAHRGLVYVNCSMR